MPWYLMWFSSHICILVLWWATKHTHLWTHVSSRSKIWKRWRLCLQILDEVCDYEQNEAAIILDASTTIGRAYFDINRPQTLPHAYLQTFIKKACLILRMLENRLGKELLLQVWKLFSVLVTYWICRKFGHWICYLFSALQKNKVE